MAALACTCGCHKHSVLLYNQTRCCSYRPTPEVGMEGIFSGTKVIRKLQIKDTYGVD